MTLAVELTEATGTDGAWDAFVATAPGGSHVQTTLWAQVKHVLGWRSARVVVRRENEIVAGCQLLLRRAGPATLAYGPRGPIAGRGDDEALGAALDGVREIAAAHPLCYLKIQPPPGFGHVGPRLRARGYSPSDLEAAPTATTMVDLTQPPERILAGMRSGTRANIRKAQRRGVTVRTGGLGDLPTFESLVHATSGRQDFSPYPIVYYREMLERFGDDATLLLAEHQGQVLSGLLIIGYNDTAVYKMGGWLGRPSSIRPNELGHWTAMQWARERGFHHYDLDGLPPAVARAVVAGRADRVPREGTAWFKLGFGGQAYVFPGAFDTSPSRLLGPLVRRAAPRLSRGRAVAQWALGRRRGRAV